MAPKYSKFYSLEVSRAKIFTIYQRQTLSYYSLPTVFYHLVFWGFWADFPATLRMKGAVWWVSEPSTYSLELRRIIALTHRYSLCCSFSSRNLEVMARSISKISKIPSTHFPSSLWKHIQHITKKAELRSWLRQIKVKAWRRLQKAHLISSLGEFNRLSQEIWIENYTGVKGQCL